MWKGAVGSSIQLIDTIGRASSMFGGKWVLAKSGRYVSSGMRHHFSRQTGMSARLGEKWDAIVPANFDCAARPSQAE